MREDALSMIEKTEAHDKLSAALNESFYYNKSNGTEELPLVTHPHIEFDVKNNEAMDALVDTMSKNQAIAEFMEIKVNTQNELGIKNDSTSLMTSLSEKIALAPAAVDSNNNNNQEASEGPTN